MSITSNSYKKIIKIIEIANHHIGEADIRASISEPILDLLGADQFASFCWNNQSQAYEDGIFINMDPSNINQYKQYYQFNDPITRPLSQRKRTTLVNSVISQHQLEKTEFFNDFLSKDKLHYGINLHLYHLNNNIGDLRIWRKKEKGNFCDNSCLLLDTLKPHLINAIKNRRIYQDISNGRNVEHPENKILQIEQQYRLTNKEKEVVFHITQGKNDEEISKNLHISKTTLRTHLKNIFKKTGVNSRTRLACMVANGA